MVGFDVLVDWGVIETPCGPPPWGRFVGSCSVHWTDGLRRIGTSVARVRGCREKGRRDEEGSGRRQRGSSVRSDIAGAEDDVSVRLLREGGHFGFGMLDDWGGETPCGPPALEAVCGELTGCYGGMLSVAWRMMRWRERRGELLLVGFDVLVD